MSPRMEYVLNIARRDALACCATGNGESFVGIRPGFRNAVSTLDAPAWIASGSVYEASIRGLVLVSVVERGAA